MVPGASSRATHSASRLAIVPDEVRCPRCGAATPSIPASASTASRSMAAVAGPPSSAWLLGLSSIVVAYAAHATGAGGLSIWPAYSGSG